MDSPDDWRKNKMEKKTSYTDAHVRIAKGHAKNPRTTHANLMAARRKHK
jgi:hypothetical protein